MVRESGDVGLLLVPAVTNFERVEAKSLSRRRARKLRREDSTEVGPFLTILDPVWKILDTFWTFSALVWSIFDESPVLAGFVELSDPFVTQYGIFRRNYHTPSQLALIPTNFPIPVLLGL